MHGSNDYYEMNDDDYIWMIYHMNTYLDEHEGDDEDDNVFY